MEAAPIAIGISLLIIVLCVIGIVFAGVKSIASGKQDTKKMAIMAVPFVIYGITYAVLGSTQDAGVATLLVMIALMFGLILVTGIKGVFRF
jgi:hypothetical protein